MASVVVAITGGFLHCQPLQLNWETPVWNHKYCFDIKPLYSAIVAVGLVVDILTWAMPHYVVWGMQLRLAHKLAITAIFAIGTLSGAISRNSFYHTLTGCRMIIIGAIRIANITSFAPGGDLTNSLSLQLLLNLTQMSVGIVVACMPHMRSVLEKIVPQRFTRINRPKNMRSGLSGGKARVRQNSISVTTTIDVRDDLPYAVFPVSSHDGQQDWWAPTCDIPQTLVVPQRRHSLNARGRPSRVVGCYCPKTQEHL